MINKSGDGKTYDRDLLSLMDEAPYTEDEEARDRLAVEKGPEAVRDWAAAKVQAVRLSEEIRQRNILIPPVVVAGKVIDVFEANLNGGHGTRLLKLVDEIGEYFEDNEDELIIELPGITMLAVLNALSDGFYNFYNKLKDTFLVLLPNTLAQRGIKVSVMLEIDRINDEGVAPNSRIKVNKEQFLS